MTPQNKESCAHAGIVTKDDEQTQFAIQVIREHRKRYPDSKKETLLIGIGPVG